MLDYNKFDEYNWLSDTREEDKKKFILDQIQLRKDRLAEKEKAIENLTYERDLVFNDLCNVIKSDLGNSSFNIFYGLNDDIFWKAWKYENYKKEFKEEVEKGEITKEEAKQYKFAFEYTVSHIREVFFDKELDKEIKFKGIIKSWIEGYDYHFTYKDVEFYVFIPNFCANKETWKTMLSGYRVNYEESKSCWSYVAGGLDVEQVKDKLTEWLKDESWHKDEPNKDK